MALTPTNPETAIEAILRDGEWWRSKCMEADQEIARLGAILDDPEQLRERLCLLESLREETHP